MYFVSPRTTALQTWRTGNASMPVIFSGKGADTVCEEFLLGPLSGKEPIRVLSCGMIWCSSHGREIILMKTCSINLDVKKVEEFSNPGQHIHSRNKTEWIGV